MIETLKAGVRDLNPGYFAVVMATGIVSIAAWFEGMAAIGQALFALNNVIYALLWLLTFARLAFYPSRLLEDLTSHGAGAGFLTAVAATCVLGSQYVIIADSSATASVLWAAGILLWLVLIYVFFAAITIAEAKPRLETGLNGAWLLAAVATQSIAVLGVLLSPRLPIGRETGLFVALSAFLLGSMFYLLIITLILYRFTFFQISAEAMSPPYWINMGAVAIATLAGARLIQNASASSLLRELRPFLIGFTLFFWTTATWWIPLLLVLGAWRHLVKRHPLRYHPQYWSIVFPLGMYTAATYQLARAIDTPFLPLIPRYFVFVALAAWIVTFTAMVASITRGFVQPNPRPG